MGGSYDAFTWTTSNRVLGAGMVPIVLPGGFDPAFDGLGDIIPTLVDRLTLTDATRQVRHRDGETTLRLRL